MDKGNVNDGVEGLFADYEFNLWFRIDYYFTTVL